MILHSRGVMAAAALLICLSTAVLADDQPTPKPDESQLIEHGHYVDKDGVEVHSPAHTKTGQPPPGATAKCADGTYSFSLHHSGTCSHHGGVVRWFN